MTIIVQWYFGTPHTNTSSTLHFLFSPHAAVPAGAEPSPHCRAPRWPFPTSLPHQLRPIPGSHLQYCAHNIPLATSVPTHTVQHGTVGTLAEKANRSLHYTILYEATQVMYKQNPHGYITKQFLLYYTIIM